MLLEQTRAGSRYPPRHSVPPTWRWGHRAVRTGLSNWGRATTTTDTLARVGSRSSHVGHQAQPLVGGGHTMPKAIKGNARRKPPEPSASHSDIDNWTQRQMPHLQPILKLLDESIRATIPGLQYAVKGKRPYYGLPEYGWIIEIAAYDVSVNVVFLGGADFDCPPPLGTTDRTRYFKETTLEAVQRPELLQ